MFKCNKLNKLQKLLELFFLYLYFSAAKSTRYCSKCNETFDDIKKRGVCFCPKCKSKLLRQCLKCKKTEPSQYAIYRHIKKCYPSQVVSEKCSNRLISFNDEVSLTEHMTKCREKLQLFCDHCDFKTDDRSSLINHIKSHEACKSNDIFQDEVGS